MVQYTIDEPERLQALIKQKDKVISLGRLTVNKMSQEPNIFHYMVAKITLAKAKLGVNTLLLVGEEIPKLSGEEVSPDHVKTAINSFNICYKLLGGDPEKVIIAKDKDLLDITKVSSDTIKIMIEEQEELDYIYKKPKEIRKNAIFSLFNIGIYNNLIDRFDIDVYGLNSINNPSKIIKKSLGEEKPVLMAFDLLEVTEKTGETEYQTIAHDITLMDQKEVLIGKLSKIKSKKDYENYVLRFMKEYTNDELCKKYFDREQYYDYQRLKKGDKLSKPIVFALMAEYLARFNDEFAEAYRKEKKRVLFTDVWKEPLIVRAFSHEIRQTIIDVLEKPMRLTELTNEVKKRLKNPKIVESSLSTHLKLMMDAEIIKKESKGVYKRGFSQAKIWID